MRFEPDDVPQGPPPRRLDADLDRVLAGLGAPPAEVLTTIAKRWPELIGPDAAAICEPLSVSDGCLVIVVGEPAWVSQLRWMEADVVRRAAEVLGEGIVVRTEVRTARTTR
jgi:hypothetical protein